MHLEHAQREAIKILQDAPEGAEVSIAGIEDQTVWLGMGWLVGKGWAVYRGGHTFRFTQAGRFKAADWTAQ